MIKFIVFDFDGVFTDNKFYFNNNNEQYKCYNGKDAYALKIIKNNNLKSGVITNDKIISIEKAPHIFDRLDKISIGKDKPKLDILNEWLEEFNLSLNDVAYIGDDLPDIPILEKVGFSGCPNDAINNVKNICNYICKNNGGNGAVREFVDLIINNNINIKENINQKLNKDNYNNNKITAVIPVRKGSTRCKNKNIRNFGDTNLLELKIKTLKQVKEIDKILISSNCDKMLKIAKDMNVDTHKRDEEFCNNDNPGNFFCNLANNITTNVLMHVPVTSPLISVSQYNNIIEKWNNNHNKYNSLNTVSNLKEFIWYKNKSINYNSNNPPPSQNLPEYNYLNFGCNIIRKNDVLKFNNIIGNKPLFVITDSISGFDIDHPSEFITSELLYNNNIMNNNICNLILNQRNDNLELLDCTIRDGGYLNNWIFTDKEVLECYKAVTEANYDYFEIGFRTNYELLPNKGKWCYSTENNINNIFNEYNGCKISVMAKIGTVTINDFIPKNKSNITMVRVLLARITQENDIQKSYYNKLDIIKAKEFCQQLIGYGYEVCMNFGCGDIITIEEIQIIASIFHNIKIKAIYLADTYGGFSTKNLPKQLHLFYNEFNKYNSNITFGFHSHNNNENALEKTKIAIFNGCNIVDSCIGGLGRGSGNLKSELLMAYKYSNNKNQYISRIKPLINYFNNYILSKKEYKNNKFIQSHPYYMIAGYLSLHPNYILDILNLDTEPIYDIEIIVKIDRYTKENNIRNYDKLLINKFLTNKL